MTPEVPCALRFSISYLSGVLPQRAKLRADNPNQEHEMMREIFNGARACFFLSMAQLRS